jgi:hypothetical protein
MKLHRLLLALPLLFAACGDDGSAGTHDAPGIVDGGIDAPPDASCFTNPTTHNEIINACTTAQKIYKDPTLPLLNPDGSLPPLP